MERRQRFKGPSELRDVVSIEARTLALETRQKGQTAKKKARIQ